MSAASFLNVSRPGRLARLLRRFNPVRRSRFYQRGWDEIGRMHGHHWAGNTAEVERRIKRANWIHNLVVHGVVFRGVKLR